jgi:hypothetical protein
MSGIGCIDIIRKISSDANSCGQWLCPSMGGDHGLKTWLVILANENSF